MKGGIDAIAAVAAGAVKGAGWTLQGAEKASPSQEARQTLGNAAGTEHSSKGWGQVSNHDAVRL